MKSLEHQSMTMENIMPERLHDFAANLLNGYSSQPAYRCFATMKDPDILARILAVQLICAATDSA